VVSLSLCLSRSLSLSLSLAISLSLSISLFLSHTLSHTLSLIRSSLLQLSRAALQRKKVGGDYYGSREDAALQVWPTGPLVVPGNTLTVVFQSATDYANSGDVNKFGVRLVATAHKPMSRKLSPLLYLECELVYALGMCLSQALCIGDLESRSKPKTDDGASRVARCRLLSPPPFSASVDFSLFS
jgi:hypothetical protein